MASVRAYAAENMSMSVDKAVETVPGHCDPCTEGHDSIERECLSQSRENVSQDMCPIVLSVEPQLEVCSALSSLKFPPAFSEECSYMQTNNAPVTSSQQPTPEFLVSLGIQVRDFAYENTLPAIVPVPRVPRQVQPAPRALKRAQRDWDDDEGPLSPPQPLPTGSKKPRFLERKSTEPLQEPVVRQTRTLERITVKRSCSIISSSARTFLAAPHARTSASPPTSPLTPPLPYLSYAQGSQSGPVQTTTPFPLSVHMDDTPAIYAHFALDLRSSPGDCPAPSSPQSSPLVGALLGQIRESRPVSRGGKHRARSAVSATASSSRYHLRQRPTPSSRASGALQRTHATRRLR